MRIGLFFGSFNPIHIGHLIIANYALNETELGKIWFIVSPLNPFKTNDLLLDENIRFDLVKTAIKNDKRMLASDVEFKLSRPSFTINTLDHLNQNYPANKFSIIMGSDTLAHLHKWKDFESITSNNKLLIYPRPGFDIKHDIKAEIEIINAPQLDISSTAIRELIKRGKSVRYLLPENVRKEIEKHEYYRK